MYYEFYIDRFFVEQVWTECLLLMLTAFLAKRHLSFFRLLTGSVAGALGTILLVWFGIPVFWPVVTVAAGCAAFGRKSGKSRSAKPCVLLLFVTFCFGGTLEAVTELTGWPFFVGTSAVLSVLYGLLRLLMREKERQQTMVGVIIRRGAHTIRTRGLFDTGNLLVEPLTGKPVSVISAVLAEKLLEKGWEQTDGYFLIPYRSIGCEKGWMKGIRADSMKMTLENGSQTVINPILAISEIPLNRGDEYGLILSPRLQTMENLEK